MSPSEAKDRAQEQWTAVDDYIDRLLVRPDALMSAVLEACAEAGLPPIGVTPNQGKLLMLLAQMQGARRILEIGTLGGYSSIWAGARPGRRRPAGDARGHR